MTYRLPDGNLAKPTDGASLMPAKPDYLDYPINDIPEPGQRVNITDDIAWIRMPLPFLLGHINLWQLTDGVGVSLVDSGLNTDETHDHWRRLLRGKKINRMIVTHLHPDHIGSAGWICREYDTHLSMSRTEYFMCRVLAADTGKDAPLPAIAFYRSAGFDDKALDRYIKRFGQFGSVIAPIPESFHRLADGDILSINNSSWQVITTSGHCPEHVSLFNAEKNVVIAGDQLLPTISSNVSVWPTEPDADPLGAWLDSCRRLKHLLPEDVLVLPSHGKPFVGAHGRLHALIDEHETGLDKLLDVCKQPRRAIDVFSALFKSRISDSNLLMATGESLAHLNYLVQRGYMVRERNADGIDWYQTVSA